MGGNIFSQTCVKAKSSGKRSPTYLPQLLLVSHFASHNLKKLHRDG
jgi:hypothetical protein